VALLSILASASGAEGNAITLPLNDASSVRPRNVTVEAVRYAGSNALEVRLTGPYRGPDMDTFAFVPGLDFHDGTIEVDVAGSLLPNAPSGARGFVGVAFRINENDGNFFCEGLYVRPTNSRSEDQIRRNRSTQYFSYPATILSAFVVKRRASTSRTPTSCQANGPICGSRCRGRTPSFTSALPSSLSSLCTI
jgi:hypothetical protein